MLQKRTATFACRNVAAGNEHKHAPAAKPLSQVRVIYSFWGCTLVLEGSANSEVQDELFTTCHRYPSHARIKHEDGNDDGTHVFNAAITKGILHDDKLPSDELIQLLEKAMPEELRPYLCCKV